MENIRITKNQPTSFIGSWIIEDNTLIDDIVSFFDKNHERHTPSVSKNGKIDKKQKNFIGFKINVKEINENKIECISNFIRILTSCYKDYKKNWDFLNKWEKLYLDEVSFEKHLIAGHHLAFHCDKMNINTSHKLFTWAFYLSDFEKDEGSIDFKYLNFSVTPKKGTLLIFPSDWTHIHRENVMKKNEKYVLKGCFHFADTFEEIEKKI